MSGRRSDGPRLSELSPERYQRVCDLVARVAELDAAGRAAALAEADRRDPSLRVHVDTVLASLDSERVATRAEREALGAATAERVPPDDAAPASGPPEHGEASAD